MSKENDVMKFVAGENGTSSEENLSTLRFEHYETHMEWLWCEVGNPAVQARD